MNTEILRLLTWEDVLEIVNEIESVFDEGDEETTKSPEAYYNRVLKRLREKNKVLLPLDERYRTVLFAAERATGYNLTSTREAVNSLIRSIVAYQLVKEGYHYSEIGKVMQRNHSTISHYIKKVKNMLSVPNSYKREMDIFNEFVRLVGD